MLRTFISSLGGSLRGTKQSIVFEIVSLSLAKGFLLMIIR